MLRDRFVRIMLVIIAILLALNLVRPGANPVESVAGAQVVVGTGNSAQTFDIKPVRGYQVTQLKEVVALGDGKSFVVSNPNGFMVYQLNAFGQ